jgi:hypothetical protein
MQPTVTPVFSGERESLDPVGDFYDELFRVLFAGDDRFTVRQLMACVRALDVPNQVTGSASELQDHVQRHVGAGKLILGSSGGRIDYRRSVPAD